MNSPVHGLGVRDVRTLISAFGRFRSAARPTSQFVVAAGERVKIATNYTPFPMTVIVQQDTPSPSAFAPSRDSIGNTMLIAIQNTGDGASTFIVPTTQELWVTAQIPTVYNVAEVRV